MIKVVAYQSKKKKEKKNGVQIAAQWRQNSSPSFSYFKTGLMEKTVFCFFFSLYGNRKVSKFYIQLITPLWK